MSYQIYIKIINQLSQALSQKLNTSVSYSQNTSNQNHSLKWMYYEDHIAFPLYVKQSLIGSLKIEASQINNEKLMEVYNIIQWTLFSIESIFDKHDKSEFTEYKNYPLLIESLHSSQSLKTALDIYEKSPAQSFIHCHSSIWDQSFFTPELKNTFIFISDLSSLHKKKQLFLSHYLKSTTQKPYIAGSINQPLNHITQSSQIMPSLLKCFNPIHISKSTEGYSCNFFTLH